MAEYIVEKKQTSGGWTWAEPKGKLIRCKDCKHFDRNEESRKEGGMFNICGEGRGMFLNENDFCSSAERKEK